MKPKIIIAMYSGLLAGSLAVSAQNNPPAATDASGSPTNAAAQASAPAAGATSDSSTTSTNVAVPAGSAVTSTNADTQAATGTNDMAGATNEVAGASTPAAAPIIPLVVMDDVPLTDAIKNLARQANINYMLDPRIAFGQPGPDGKPVPQPTVSIRWENVTAEQALTALLNNYSLQLDEDPKTKIARITIKDPAAPDPLITKIIQLKYASPTNILSAVQTALIDKRSRVMGDIRTSQLVVVATEKEMDAVDQLVERLDTQTKQVLIEAKLMETSINPTTIKGIDWSGTLAAQHVAMGNNALPGTPPTPPTPAIVDPTTGQITPAIPAQPGTIGGILSAPQLIGSLNKGAFLQPNQAFLNADGVNAVVSFLNNNSEAKVIAEPRAVTLDNETAHLSVTRATPIINVTAGTANTTGGSSIIYTNLGVLLDVTPRVSANNYINLKVVPEVSRKFDTVSKTVGGQIFQADEYDVRIIETRVMIPSGNTLVLGGLVSDDIRSGNTKVPILGDIPILGLAFRSDSKARNKSNLLVFITPSIVQDTDFQETKSDFLKTPLTHDRTPDWGPWNSGKPWDWSKITPF
jgi:type II secretory pathway component GspD/PulD (secretin)